jgi:hypothetical protein
MIKTNSFGNTIWSKSDSQFVGKSVCEVSDGFIVTGNSEWLMGGDVFLIKTNFAGNTLWTNCLLKSYPQPHGSANASTSSMITTKNGNYLVGAKMFITDMGDPSTYDGYVMLYDTDGDSLWKINVVTPPIWSSVKFESVIQTNDSCYLAAGGYEGGYGEDTSKIFLAKISASDPITDLKKLQNVTAKTFILSQNYPNPFNPISTIAFDLPKTSEVTLQIFNILGEEVATLVSERLSAGSYSYEWDASNLASGVYLYRLQAGKYVETRKMVLMR